MKRIVMLAAGVFALSRLVSGNPAPGSAESPLAREAIEAEKSYWSAETRGDVAAIERLLADDFIQVTTGPRNDFSVTRGKKEALAEAREMVASGKLAQWHIDDPTAQVYGSTVILTYTWTETFVPNPGPGRDGAPRKTRGIATSVWSKGADGWKNVNFHWHTRPAEERSSR